MVAVSEEGRPAQVAQLVPATPDERRRFEAAKARKELRREMESRYRAMKGSTPTSAAIG
jgi:acyl-CoA hydrolase